MSFSVCEIKNLLNASKIDGLIVGGEGGVWGRDFSYSRGTLQFVVSQGNIYDETAKILLIVLVSLVCLLTELARAANKVITFAKIRIL